MDVYCRAPLRYVAGRPDHDVAVRFIAGPLRPMPTFRIVGTREAQGRCLAFFERHDYEYDSGPAPDAVFGVAYCLEDVETGEMVWSDLADRRWHHVVAFPKPDCDGWPVSVPRMEWAMQTAWSVLVMADPGR